MLVLSRKKEETVVIGGGQIEIKVLKIKGNLVRLGISAPEDVKIMRGEISPFQIDVDLSNETASSASESELAAGGSPLSAKLRNRKLKTDSNSQATPGAAPVLDSLPLVDAMPIAHLG